MNIFKVRFSKQADLYFSSSNEVCVIEVISEKDANSFL